VFHKVTVAYRGAKYEIGRGRDFFGIWPSGGAGSAPLERWPDTPDGWSAAWARLIEIEEPGTIAPAGRNAPLTPNTGHPQGIAKGQRQSTAALSAIAAGLLLAAGVALGVASLFPDYFSGTRLASEPAELVPHVIYLAAWSASAVLILLGGTRLRAGALLGTGVSVVTFGLFLADAGTPISGGAHLAGAGMWLGLAGWLACAAGSVAALLLRPAGEGAGIRGRLRVPRGPELGPAVLLVLAGIGVAVAFAPAWDGYTLRTAAGQTQYITAGNAFSNPGPVIAGDVAVMIAFAAVVIAAAAWRPVRHGAVLLAGAVIPMAAQAVSALVQVGEATPPQQFGLSPAQASQLGLTIDNGLTPVFWVYCAFGVALVVSCLWMLFTPQPGARPAPGLAGDAPPADASIKDDASVRDDAHGWKPDAYAWYAATPETAAPKAAENHADAADGKAKPLDDIG
jgi:hypothetical protein